MKKLLICVSLLFLAYHAYHWVFVVVSSSFYSNLTFSCYIMMTYQLEHFRLPPWPLTFSLIFLQQRKGLFNSALQVHLIILLVSVFVTIIFVLVTNDSKPSVFSIFHLDKSFNWSLCASPFYIYLLLRIKIYISYNASVYATRSVVR